MTLRAQMGKSVARYNITFGLSGCYMPDSYGGVIECHTRRDLAESVRDYLRMYELPASLFQQVRIKRLWSFIKNHGSSSAHFSLEHKGFSLSFSGMTEEEMTEALENQDY
jgi:hypothetical protein